jgi:hypothetical protein
MSDVYPPSDYPNEVGGEVSFLVSFSKYVFVQGACGYLFRVPLEYRSEKVRLALVSIARVEAGEKCPRDWYESCKVYNSLAAASQLSRNKPYSLNDLARKQNKYLVIKHHGVASSVLDLHTIGQ